MGTLYSEIIDVFLGKITDYHLPQFSDLEKETILFGYMRTACAKFNKVCEIDLFDRDDNLQQFNNTLDDEQIDIIVETMLVEWLKPKVLNTDNLENSLSTKDFSQYSPANLLSELRNTLKELKKESRVLINNYSFAHADVSSL